jgi:methionyl-tRNA formyltransferase
MGTKQNIIFCGYREWAKEIIYKISNHPKINCVDIILSIDEYLKKEEFFSEDVDIIVFLGWSWIIPDKVTSKFLCLGMHPSDLPFYRGGSPIQHQIINGIKDTKVTLMTLSSEKIDGGDIWLKNDLSLEGDSIDDVFKNIIYSTIKLLKLFFDEYPNITPWVQDLNKGSYYKRRKKNESKVLLSDISSMNLEELYNKARCLTDPYPNLFIEDKLGNKLFITGMKFKNI